MAVLTTVNVVVSIDTTGHTFTATAEGETSGPQISMAASLAGLTARIAHVHDELQDVIDDDLTDSGKNIRDTPITF